MGAERRTSSTPAVLTDLQEDCSQPDCFFSRGGRCPQGLECSVVKAYVQPSE
ncbi:hypothetical protein PAMP_013068 [Pampus punctatissimus]